MFFTVRNPILGLALAMLSQAASAQSAAVGHIDRITLSSGGVAELHRQADVDGKGSIQFDVPLADVDDVLKSLVVSDPGGSVDAVSLDGLAPVEETFKSLPFTADDLGSMPDLLQRLPGTRVRVTSGGRTVEGLVLGTASQPPASPSESPDGRAPQIVRTLSVLNAKQEIETLKLDSDTAVAILDDAMRDRLAGALGTLAQSRSDQIRRIAIAVSGTGKRQVGLSYVAAAPIWKPAFRLVLGAGEKARLQGWAVLENATGEDWKDVDLTLATGAPVALTQKLHQRYWHDRPDIPVNAGVGEMPRTDDSSAIPDRRRSALARSDAAGGAYAKEADVDGELAEPPPPPAPAALARPMPMQAMARPTAQATAQESTVSASFHLPAPVTLARAGTLSLPFMDAEVPAERLALFQPDRRSPNPVAAVMVKNTTPSSLPPGIVTVYDGENGYAGDAAIPALAAGADRLVSFAADKKVQIAAQTQPEERITRISVSDGVLSAMTVSRLHTTYTIQGANDGARTVLIEHPRRVGFTGTSTQLDSTTPTHYRLRVPVAAGATATAQMDEERPRTQTFALADADAEAFLQWSVAPAAPGLSDQLKQLARLRGDLAGAEQAATDIDAKLAAKVEDQSRLRENLGAVPSGSELGRRYLRMMASAEDEIGQLTAQKEKAVAAIETRRQAFAQALRAL
jgi:hypothetical protein